jgi:hypothetical protein
VIRSILYSFFPLEERTMSSGMNFMYGHVFGAHARKPHIDTVRAIRRSNVDPYITAPFGVDPSIARPGPRNTPFIETQEADVQNDSTPETSNNDIDDIINMITSDPELKPKPVSKGQHIIRKLVQPKQ